MAKAIVSLGGKEAGNRYRKILASCIRRFSETIKSQISSSKLQINLKLQYSMTKTFTAIVSLRFANPGLPVMKPLGANTDRSLF